MKDKRVDAYMAKSADFAMPILEHFRSIVHKACPDVQETIKWGMPHFDYKGIMCSMAAFKQHCAFSFWKAALMKDPSLMANAKSESAMGHLGKISSVKDLPGDKILIGYIKEAMKLNEEGVKVEKKPLVKRAAIKVPDYFKKALAQNKAATQAFDAFSASHKREYLEWITEAKTEATRTKRVEQTIEWLAEGKPRNWKYVKK